MNYRHAYHAGNFADVVKHAILARILTYMKLKPQPFRVIDTHAGTGRYDLGGVEASKTGEWRDGIARLTGTETGTDFTGTDFTGTHFTGQDFTGQGLPADVAVLLQPYLDVVTSLNVPGALTVYPGSPVIARRLMRPGDHLVANELHPDDFAALKAEFRRVPDTKVLNLDAWVALKSLLPPPERRGVVLIDPPYEAAGEFAHLPDALSEALKRFATGVYIIWYPVKDHDVADQFVRAASHLSSAKILDVRLTISRPFAGLGLTETGLLILNPPYSLHGELQTLMPFLVERLAEGQGASYRLDLIRD